MAGILQGAGGPTLDVEDEDKLKGVLSQYMSSGYTGGKEKVDAGGPAGNASSALAAYLGDTEGLLNKKSSYDTEYTPYIPKNKIGDIIAEQEEGGDGEGSGSGGPPKPGEPGYEEYMMYNAGPDSPDAGKTKGFADMTAAEIESFGKFLDKMPFLSRENYPGFPQEKVFKSKRTSAKDYSEAEAPDSSGGASNYGDFSGGQTGQGSGATSGGFGGTGQGRSGYNQGGPVEYYAKGSMCPKCGKSNCGCNYSQGGNVEYKRLGGVADPFGMTYNKLKIDMPKNLGPRKKSGISSSRKGGGGVLGQAGKIATGMVLKGALGSVLGPLGSLLAFSKGGPVGNPKYMGHGGPLGKKPMTKLEMANDMHQHKKNIMTTKMLADQGLKTEAHKIKSRSKIL